MLWTGAPVLQGAAMPLKRTAKYRMQPPAEIIKAAEAAFEHTARRVLREGRIEGNHEALLNHLVEIWNLSFAVELRRQRRRREKGLS